jgi:SOS-response transcriptional repressor LexA
MIEVDEKKGFAERLNMALDLAGIPQKGKGRQIQLASLFGVSQESARKWLEGASFPDTKRIPEIARKLNINAQWLLSGVGNINPASVIKELPAETSPFWRKVPVLTWEEAGTWEKILATVSTDENRAFAWAETEIGPNAYALIVQDDSMLPRYEPKSILIIDSDYKPTHKHVVIFLLENEKRVTCKQLIIDGNRQYLKPHNPSYPVYLVSEKDKYCGAIRQARMVY